jgi:hypothetical protein
MRARQMAMVGVGVALWASQAFAQTSPAQSVQSLSAPSQMSQPAQTSQPLPPPQMSQPTPSSQSAQTSQPTQTSQPFQPSPPSPPSQPTQSSQPPRPQYSADGLYNLANSYARAGQPGLAVLNYERAALLAPNDSDISANLEYVRTIAQVPAAPRSRLARVGQAMSPTVAAWIGVLGIVLVGAGLLAQRTAPRFRWVRAGGVLLGLAMIALTASSATLLWPRMHEAVVLTNQTPARVSPVPMGDTAFVLREAETVTMTAEHEDFILIRTSGGLSGWVARANLGAVVP